MEIIRCPKGHYYDSSKGFCPVCGREKTGITTPGRKERAVETPGATMPVQRAETIETPGATMPVRKAKTVETPGVTMPVQRAEAIETPGVTMPVQREKRAETGYCEPVTGWLVCVEGPEWGKDYRLHAGMNYIGNSDRADVCIKKDPSVRCEKEAVIGYDKIENAFYFGPGGGQNAVRVNGKMILNSVKLSPCDALTIGNSRFLFIPFCGGQFRWREIQ